MKRIANLYQKIISLDNLTLAELNARKGKTKQYGVMLFDQNREAYLQSLHEILSSKKYQTSQYKEFKIYEPKERLVYRLPYFPDRITHHAIMNVLEPIFTSLFTADTFSCIKGRGIKGAADKVKIALKDVENTKYCLKLDIVKFYPNVDHDILKQLLQKKFKDQDLLWLLFEIIDSAPGLPIGNYLSQYFANYYLTFFDHWIKETIGVKYYFRYADDIVILSNSKQDLHQILSSIKQYLNNNLKLEVKNNYQVFPVESRGIDFVGYVFRHTHTRLRKSIKKNFARAVKKNAEKSTIAAYNGWLKHCNSHHLKKKILPHE